MSTRLSDQRECFHCGLPVPAGTAYTAMVDGCARRMCCPGCAAVAQAIVDAGHGGFYRHRTSAAPRAVPAAPEVVRELEAYDHPQVQAGFVSDTADGLKAAALILEGINCAACVWLNERHLRGLDGVRQAEVNYATRRAQVTWDPARISLSRILRAIRDIGYVAHPYDPRRHEAVAEAERRKQLQRLGVAGALGMQIMMIATALYFGEWSGIDSDYRLLFQWVSLGLAVPVMLFCAQPFFAAAWRDLKRRQPGMDVPVALGLSIAFAGSVWATVSNSGPVYYESVAMFVFLLLGARYFEQVARARSVATVESLGRAMPETAQRLDSGGGCETVLADELAVGDRVLVRPGASVPADGIISDGTSSLDESLLTGESRPIGKRRGDEVIAGSINISNPLVIDIRRVRGETLIARIGTLIERAQNAKGRTVRLADRAAAWFVGGVLALALATAVFWWLHDPGQLLPVLVSVLVVTCPCALSLATPTAMTVAIGAASRSGLVPIRAEVFERLPQIDHVVLDKTGTLTEGQPRLVAATALGSLDRAAALDIAADLSAYSEHPIAHALRRETAGSGAQFSELRHEAGGGLSGVFAGRRYYLGSPAFLARHGINDAATGAAGGGGSIACLARDGEPLAEFSFADRLRPTAECFVSEFQRAGIPVSMYSGDNATAVSALARQLGITDHRAGLSPEDKLRLIGGLQSRGRTILMVGDGINDAPVLAAADGSVALGAGADLARASADMVLLNDRLQTIPWGIELARRTRRTIRQNIGWAIGYNLLALPAAVIGMVPPWLAAIGMSLSSLVVVANALRLGRQRPVPQSPHRTPAEVAFA